MLGSADAVKTQFAKEFVRTGNGQSTFVKQNGRTAGEGWTTSYYKFDKFFRLNGN